MSIPQNPLDLTPSSTYRHVLVAFKYSTDAFQLDSVNNRKIDPTSFEPGDTLPNLGQNVVVVNEFTDQRFSINEAIWDFDFTPENVGVSTSTSVGRIVIEDRFVPYQFIDFLRQNVLAVFNNDPSTEAMSSSHITFALKTYFVTEQNAADQEDLIQINPYFFNLNSIDSIPGTGSAVSPTAHILRAVGMANTMGIARPFSSIFQLNITHKDGNVHDEIQEPTNDSGIRSRQEDNQSYRELRKRRLDKSKPMLTLKDIFEGLQADLNQQKFVHQGQLQKWLREVREDHVDKISVAPQQIKGPTPEQLPMDFVIDLDPLYEDYVIDNRNMPFEQPDLRQDNVGIRSFPIRTGTDIVELVERLMMLSKRVGEDAQYPGPLTYKTTITSYRTNSNRYVINIKIRRYELPTNQIELNTGPGDNRETLEFFVNDPEERDIDIVSFKSMLNFRVGDKMLERQVEGVPGAGIVYGDREQATAERRPDLSFFETFYSGIRPMIGSYTNDGLESAERAGDIMNLRDPYTYTQTTDYEVVIRGNPFLLSDLNRNPIDVVNDEEGPVNYYQLPESHPMYVKLTIFLKSMALVDDDRIPDRFYFDNFYHLHRVVHMFGQVGETRSFYQALKLKRTDDTI